MADFWLRYLADTKSATVGAEKVAAANEASATKSAVAWDKAGATMNSRFGKLSSESSKLSSTLGSQWAAGAAIAGAAVVAFGASAVKAADAFDVSHARLSTAIDNTGGSMAVFGAHIAATNKGLEQLGFSNTETEASMAMLTTATKSAGKAADLMGLAADIARGRNIDLATATNILVKVETGHVALLGRLGIATKDAQGHTISQTEAIQRLTDLYGGQASAFTDTLAGKQAVLGAEFTDLKVKLGTGLIPVLGTYVDALSKVTGALSSAGSSNKVFGVNLTSSTSIMNIATLGVYGLIKKGNEATATFHAAGTNAAALASVFDDVNRSAKGASVFISQSADSAVNGSYAYLGLASSVKTANDALDALSKRAFAGITATIAVDTSQTGVQNALDALTNPGGGTGGGGGGGPTPAAAALDHAQKVLTLRDAMLGETDATKAVKTAQDALTQSHKDQAIAAHALGDAQQNLRTVLHGVAADSNAAKTATDQLTSAQNAAKGAKLDVNDAKRALALARSDQRLSGVGVTDAQAQLTADQNAGASAEQLLKDQVALDDARIQQKAGSEAVVRAEIALSDAMLASKGRTTDLKNAQYDLNGTLHGFPKNSKEAKDAQSQLTTAQQNARQAADQVTASQRNLLTAQNNTANSALALIRAQDDLDGKLQSSTGATSAGKKMDSLKTRIDNVKTAMLQQADAQQKYDQAIGVGFGKSIQNEILALKTFADANPMLAHAFDGAIGQLELDFSNYITTHRPPVTAPMGPFLPPAPYRTPPLGGVGPVLPLPRTSTPQVVVHIHGPIMGADVGATVHQSLKDITRRNGAVSGVRVAS